MTREQVLALARAKAPTDSREDVQVVDYSGDEHDRGEKAQSLIEKLQEMRKLWKKP